MKKVVVNGTFGLFKFGEGFCKRYGIDSPYNTDGWARDDEHLVAWVENHPNDNFCLEVIEIPDEATDWQIHEYDGMESVIAVVGGKIVWLT